MRRIAVLLVALLASAGLAAHAAAPAARPKAHAHAPKAEAHAPGARVSGPARPLPVITAVQVLTRIAAAQKAHRPMVVHFWAPWCHPCVKELPRVLKAMPGWQRHADVLLLAVAQRRDAPKARRMAGVGPGRYRLVAKDPAILARRLDREWNGALPATFVLDRTGRVVYRVIGPFSDKVVNRALGIPRAR